MAGSVAVLASDEQAHLEVATYRRTPLDGHATKTAMLTVTHKNLGLGRAARLAAAAAALGRQ